MESISGEDAPKHNLILSALVSNLQCMLAARRPFTAEVSTAATASEAEALAQEAEASDAPTGDGTLARPIVLLTCAGGEPRDRCSDRVQRRCKQGVACGRRGADRLLHVQRSRVTVKQGGRDRRHREGATEAKCKHLGTSVTEAERKSTSLLLQKARRMPTEADFMFGSDKILSKMGEGTFERVLECWDRETHEYVAIKVVRSIHKYSDATMIEIDVLNRLVENEKYRSLSFVLYPSSDCFFCSTTNMPNMAGRGLEVKPGPTVKCVLGHDFILHFPLLHLGNQRKVKKLIWFSIKSVSCHTHRKLPVYFSLVTRLSNQSRKMNILFNIDFF
ncbi:hypothetical protein ACJX0J_011938, partial [Zea mays]